MRALISKIILGLTVSVFAQIGAAASDMGSHKSIEIDLNMMIDSTDREAAGASDKLKLTFNNKITIDKVDDQQLKKLVSDEISWDKSNEARIHRVPQSLSKPIFDKQVLSENEGV